MYSEKDFKKFKQIKVRADLTGRIFGKLTVLGYVGSYGKTSYWKCRCSCGAERISSRRCLFGATKNNACKNCQTLKGKNHHSWKGVGDLSHENYTKIKLAANQRGILFSVGINYLWALFEKQNGKCSLSNIELVFNDVSRDMSKRTASLDRIDSAKGYVEGNVQWVHKDINWLKNDFDNQTFIDYCCKVADTYRKKIC